MKYSLIILMSFANSALLAQVPSSSEDLFFNQADSSMLQAYIERAQHRFDGGYYKGALEDYNTALGISENIADVWLGRGMVNEKLKNNKTALTDYTKAIELSAEKTNELLHRADLYIKLGQAKEAIEDCNTALTYDSTSAPAFYSRAIANQKIKNNTGACNDLKKAEALGYKVNEAMRAKICVP